MVLIILSVGTSCAGTLPQFSDNTRDAKNNGTAASQNYTSEVFFSVVDYFCGIWFSLELLLRVVFCPNKRKFFKQPVNWIDVLSVLPFYLRLMVPEEKLLVDALLVFRLLRLFRFFRLLYGLQVLLHTLKASSYELGLLLLILFIPVILFSSVIYYVERSMDSLDTKFRSIPESFWWSLITMTTVGYGDMTPKTWLGRIIGGVCAICGVLVVALPITIIGSNFSLYYAYAQARLKLPKKKNRVLFNSLAMEFPSRGDYSNRRRALRRRSPGTSGSDECTPPLSQRASGQSRLSGKSYMNEGRNSYTCSVASARSSGVEPMNDVKMSPKAAIRKISRERRYSRNERASFKLGDLPEKDESEESDHRNGELMGHVTRESCNGATDVRKKRLPQWVAENGGATRTRSHSVPMNSKVLTPTCSPRKSRSDGSNLCQRCCLPKSDSWEKHDEESCQCEHHNLDVPCSRNSTFSVFIPGVEENIEVSMESLPSFGMELPLCGSSPIQLNIVPARGRNYSEVSKPEREKGPEHDEQETVTSDLDSDDEKDFEGFAVGRRFSDTSDLPLVFIDMPGSEEEEEWAQNKKETKI